MDLNYLLHRQQVERSRAEAASSDTARTAHEELARRYEEKIRRLSEGRMSFPDAEDGDGSSDSDSRWLTGDRG